MFSDTLCVSNSVLTKSVAVGEFKSNVCTCVFVCMCVYASMSIYTGASSELLINSYCLFKSFIF